MSTDSQNELLTIIHRYKLKESIDADTIFHDTLRVNYITGLSGAKEFRRSRGGILEIYSNKSLIITTESIRGRDIYLDLQVIDSARRITLFFPKKDKMVFR
jgi:hypothetical protein